MITTNPYGSYIITYPSIDAGIWRFERHIRGLTLISIITTYIITLHMSPYLRPILRSTLAYLVPFVGLTHYEFWWHMGLQYTLGTWPGDVRYWRALALCSLMVVYYIDRYYVNILDLSRKRIPMILGAYSSFIVSVIILMKSGFYQQFLLWCNGTASDPHNIWWALTKIIGIMMWTTVVKNKKEESPQKSTRTDKFINNKNNILSDGMRKIPEQRGWDTMHTRLKRFLKVMAMIIATLILTVLENWGIR